MRSFSEAWSGAVAESSFSAFSWILRLRFAQDNCLALRRAAQEFNMLNPCCNLLITVLLKNIRADQRNQVCQAKPDQSSYMKGGSTGNYSFIGKPNRHQLG